MISVKVIDTDDFIEMPATTRLLYYELNIRADDDGFVGSPKKIQNMVGCSEEDYKILLSKKYVIPFESGICAIRHWKIHNYIRTDRYNETIYQLEKSTLTEQLGIYDIPHDIPTVSDKVGKWDTQVRLGKDSIGKSKDSIEKGKEREGKRGAYGALKGKSENKELTANRIRDNYNQVIMLHDKSYPFQMNEVERIFNEFFIAYKKYRGNDHPTISNLQCIDFIRKFPECPDKNGDKVKLIVSIYKPIIELYFQAKFSEDCDYNMSHFMSGSVRTLRYREALRLKGENE
jgi:hypothetical protein